MAALLLAAFTMFLRPGELFQARRCDLSLPRDRLETEGDAFLRIPAPKTRRSYPCQHARCSDHAVVRLMDVVFGDLAPTEPIAPFGASGFRTRWNYIFRALGVPLSRAPGGLNLTPACLWGSGAIDFYMVTEDIPRVFWRSTWRQASSAERYLLAAAASTVLSSLPPASRALVARFADAGDDLTFAFLEAGTQVWTTYFLISQRLSVTSQGQ